MMDERHRFVNASRRIGLITGQFYKAKPSKTMTADPSLLSDLLHITVDGDQHSFILFCDFTNQLIRRSGHRSVMKINHFMSRVCERLPHGYRHTLV